MTGQTTPLPEDLYRRLGSLPAANVGDVLDRLYVAEAAISTVWKGAKVVGPAFTVMTAGGDNKLIHEAIDTAAPGDVLVIDGQAVTHRALLGDLMGRRAKARGLAGFVVDGAIRDADDLGAIGFPTWARAVTPAGPYRNGPGLLQVPVSVGRVVVNPGDVIVGDDDGVTVIPRHRLEEIVAAAEAKHAGEEEARARIAAL
ncbi:MULTISPECIES: RraA family protein [Nocardiopsis]|uniref:Putative 4-hydroxy-4-methyl-2-oxoglutarate aldolase n=2 Tax=Nocardiopsis alba TaxID=53437 RepID=A0A7K2INK3_9ACTN|nr:MULTISPECIES: methyltransferase [Nocardiopsis]AFR06262.1 demethylmenaquinone methyltransferase family protein [Nocardiopsis alba ATCC BAA-2165]MEC3895469.1 methyltransferase [Nocardiopsis sp. LDBS1602]MYR31365.1 methyltransferase [Nocardiopsis alba]